MIFELYTRKLTLPYMVTLSMASLISKILVIRVLGKNRKIIIVLEPFKSISSDAKHNSIFSKTFVRVELKMDLEP